MAKHPPGPSSEGCVSSFVDLDPGWRDSGRCDVVEALWPGTARRADGGGLAPEALPHQHADGRLRKLGGKQVRALVLYFALSEA